MGARGSSARLGISPRERCVSPFLFGADAKDYIGDVEEIAGEHARLIWLSCRRASTHVRYVSILVDSIDGTTMSGDEI